MNLSVQCNGTGSEVGGELQHQMFTLSLREYKFQQASAE